MDVTPTPRMFQAMREFTDAMCGEEPLAVEKSPAAEQRREKRRACMDFLHLFAHKCMREGAARAFDPRRTELGRQQFPTPEEIQRAGG